MQLQFLGTGSAFTVDAHNFQSNMLFDDGADQRLLIDCGTDIRFSLHEQGFTHRDITAVYISHLHADHVGGLEWLAFSSYFDPTCQKPTLFISDALVHDLWHKVLAGGLSSLQGQITNLATYFNLVIIPPNKGFSWAGIDFQLIQTIHSMNGFMLMPSFGLFFSVANNKIFLTTDTQLAPYQIQRFYQQADLIFHDCETSSYQSGVHAHYSELCGLTDDIKQKMWLYHYQPGELPNAVSDGFLGFVQKGQVFSWL